MKKTMKLAWKELLKAKTSDKGMTLVELLLTITISAILLPVTYGTFITGYKIYEKVSIDAQLREDADYVSAMIMNTLYSYPFDVVKHCEENINTCVKFVDSRQTTLQPYVSGFYDVEKDAKKAIEETTTLELKTNGEIQQWYINGSLIQTTSDFKDSRVTFTCSEKNKDGKCSSAIIEMDFVVSNGRTDKTLDLESKFGF
jgi:prepilin-type N-terminal cleavage/methylation domain-containing protein